MQRQNKTRQDNSRQDKDKARQDPMTNERQQLTKDARTMQEIYENVKDMTEGSQHHKANDTNDKRERERHGDLIVRLFFSITTGKIPVTTVFFLAQCFVYQHT